MSTTWIVLTTVYTASNNVHAGGFERPLFHAFGRTTVYHVVFLRFVYSSRFNVQNILTKHREIRHDTLAHCGISHDATSDSLIRLPRIMPLCCVCSPQTTFSQSTNTTTPATTGAAPLRAPACAVAPHPPDDLRHYSCFPSRSRGGPSRATHHEGASDDPPPQRRPFHVYRRCHEGLHDEPAGLDERPVSFHPS